LIEVKGLTKNYGQHVAIDHLDFSVKKGDVLGFLGPNGAGKTTTMNIITGYISATEGSVTVDGYDVLASPREVKSRIGYMPEFPPLYPDMTVVEYLDFVSKIKRIEKSKKKSSLEKIMDLVKIADVQNRLIKNLSKGYQQRVGVAQALVGDPPVLILDEPTIGLDPNQIIEIRNLIKSLGKEHTVVLSSHILPEVTAICERVIIIHRGKIAASDTIQRLSTDLKGSAGLTVRVAGAGEEVVRILTELPQVASAEFLGIREPDTSDIHVLPKSSFDVRKPVFHAMSRAGKPILMMKSSDLTLEEIFIRITTEDRPQQAPGEEDTTPAKAGAPAAGVPDKDQA
jgi:ABC-2 type transport system ATP-binding protein